jgi:hypothetical protein
MKILFPICLILLVSTYIRLHAQGCSDAGACTLPSLQHAGLFDQMEKKNSFSFGLTGGGADHNIFAFGAHAGYHRKFGNAFSADAKLTYAARSGNDINTSGFGDIYVMLNYRFSPSFTATGGVKMPLNEADRTFEGRMLPMDYQTSLGTPDLIFGVSYTYNNWLIALGYQQPVDQNQNVFIPSEWPSDSPISDFVQTGMYDRSGDVLMRISRIIPLQGNVTIIPGLLPIYHLRNDIDYLTFERVEIEGSAGLTLNATLQAEIKSGLHNKLNLSLGFPMLVRKVRPDGLTRSFVMGVEIIREW